jgi:hypothetical protein
VKITTTAEARAKYLAFMAGDDDYDGITTKYLMSFAKDLCDDVEALIGRVAFLERRLGIAR